MQTGVIVLFHGSRAGGADAAARRLCDDVVRQGGYDMVEPAYLQHVRPGLADAVEAAVRRGAERIVIVPFFMLPGAHVTADIPALVDAMKAHYPSVRFSVTGPVGAHPLMATIVAELVQKQG